MVSWMFKLSPLLRHSIRAQGTQNLCFFRLEFLSTSLKSRCPESAGKNEDKKSFTVSYLISTLGFSAEEAHASTKRFTFETPDKPDSVISFLYNHGLTKTQISNIAQRVPSLLISDPDKVLLPKIEFFKSLGFSKTDVASIVFAAPYILHRSLEKQLIPSVRLLKDLFQSDDAMLTALKRHDNRILCVDIESTLVPNMEYLKQSGVPVSNIMRLLTTQPRTLSPSHDHFRKIVDEVTRMKVNPGEYVFLLAIQVILSMSKEKWEKKINVYTHWGFTEEKILEAFRKQPQIMKYSGDKVTEMMSYLVNEMGFESSLVFERPELLGLSLKKRIIPRCSVYRILSEKNLLPKEFSIKEFLMNPEEEFLHRYVAPFKAQVPELLNFSRLEFLSTSLKGRCSESAGKKEDKKLFTVNYLITTLDFSPQKAHFSAERFTFETPDKPDSVISFLYNHGLTKTQISNIAQRFPQLIISDPEKILLPKLEFFKSLGFSKTDVASIVFAAPSVLHRSLEKQLIPSIRLLKGLFQSDDAMLAALKCPDNRILCVDVESTLVPNTEYLKQLGVPVSNIMQLLATHPTTLSQSHDHFRMVVDDVMKMRVNPAKYVCLWAIIAMSVSKETWEKKMKVYLHWGFTEVGILEAFRKHPQIMMHSVDKVTDLLSYLVNDMGFKSSLVFERPQLLSLSLQKRIIPRCYVYRILSEKNLVPQKFSITQFLEYPEKKFISRYVEPFEAQVPELLNLYTKHASCLT